MRHRAGNLTYLREQEGKTLTNVKGYPASGDSTPASQPDVADVPPISPDELLLLQAAVTDELNTILDGGQL